MVCADILTLLPISHFKKKLPIKCFYVYYFLLYDFIPCIFLFSELLLQPLTHCPHFFSLFISSVFFVGNHGSRYSSDYGKIFGVVKC